MSAFFWDSPTVILIIIIVVLVVDNLWSMYLLTREISIVKKVKSVPTVLAPYMHQDVFQRMRAYKLHKSWFTLINTIIVVLICGVLELSLGFYAFVWDVACKCVPFSFLEHEVWISIIYVVLLSVYLTLKGLPGALYESFCIPTLRQKREESLGRKICREILDTILALVLISILVTVLVFLGIGMGAYSFIGLFLIALLLTVLLILLVPLIIDPFVGKRVDLENESLKKSLESLTASVGFPMKQVYIIKTHDPNTGSNAFFYGSCCLKRIVIFDTLLLNKGLRDTSEMAPEDLGKGLTNIQVIAVVAHELGHWMHGHFYKAILMFKVHLLLSLLLFGLCFPHGPIYQAVGFEEGVQPIVVGFLIIFGFVMTPYLTFSNFFLLSVTRHFEYQADCFAYELGYAKDLRQALLKLYADNLSFPISDQWYSSWNHTHPTMLDRLRVLEELETGVRWRA